MLSPVEAINRMYIGEILERQHIHGKTWVTCRIYNSRHQFLRSNNEWEDEHYIQPYDYNWRIKEI